MFNGILFDLDGTLIDSSELMAAAVCGAMNAGGLKPPCQASLIQKVREQSPIVFLRGQGISKDAYWKAYLSCLDHVQLVDPRLPEALAFERSKGIRLGIVTSLPARPVHAVLNQLGLTNTFDSLVTYGRTYRHKPHPDPVLLGVEELDLPPADCVYIGDSPDDIEAGKRAGVQTAAALYGFGNPKDLLEREPQMTITHPEELLRICERRPIK